MRVLFRLTQGGESIATVVTERKRWLLFGPIVTTTREYIGSSTVWRHFPTFDRCSTSMEEWLCGLWWKWKHKCANQG